MNTVRMFWHGGGFSLYEDLSVRSFLRHGFQVEVFSYTPLNLPDGSVWRNAAEILPASDVFTYRNGAGAGSVSAFSNLFRYKLLYELGGIWADSDLLCLKPFAGLPESFVGLQDSRTCNGAVMKCSAGSEMCRWLYETARSMGKDIRWGQTGPRLITQAVIERRDKAVIPLPEQVFYPIPWRRAVDLGIPEKAAACETASAGSYCVHWWNEIFRRFAVPKSKLPPRGSFLANHAETLLDESATAFWSEAEFLAWLGEDHDAANLKRPSGGEVEVCMPNRKSIRPPANVRSSGSERSIALDCRIALIPAGDRNTASSRIRVFQLRDALGELGVRSEIGYSDSADVWFVQKRLTEELLAAARAGKAMGKRIVYDVDDLGAALWYWAPEELFRAMLGLADHVTTATVEQGMVLQQRYGVENWTAIANCIDYFPDAPLLHTRPDSADTRVIWFGNAGNFRLMTKYVDAVMGMESVKLVAVVGEREVEKLRQTYPAIEFHGWTLSGFLPLLRSCDLAVLAHDGGEEDRKKGNNRMITAIHYGVPAVVSRTPEYVRTALYLGVEEALFSNREELLVAVDGLRSAAARQGYLRRAQGKCWEMYSPEAVARQFLQVFRA